jgi:hypothetical protein
MIASRWTATCAWIAGFLDGEGCLDLTRRGQLRIRATQKYLLPLRRLQALTGAGKIYKDRDAYVWYLGRRKQVYHVLCHVLPYLQTNKKPQGELMLAYYRGCITLEEARELISDLKRSDVNGQG